MPPPPSGAEGIIGASASSLLNRFGQPRIDLAEGDARKLQFASDRCILDVFLYPPSAGRAPIAGHAEARRRDGGSPVDARACAADIEAR